MAIKRNTNQSVSENLEEFYEHFGELIMRNTCVSNAMLFPIDMIDHLLKETTIWGLTQFQDRFCKTKRIRTHRHLYTFTVAIHI